MNNLEYLNQISQSSRSKPVLKKPRKISPSLILKIVVGSLVSLFIIIAIATIANNSTNKSSELSKQLYLRMTNLHSTLSTYNKSLKSSKLRAIGISLSGTLLNSSNQLSTYITANETKKNPLVPNTETVASETASTDRLNNILNSAKLNGILDRIYLNQIQLQVSLLTSLDTQTIARTKDPALLQILNQLHSNLTTIEQSFQEYSDPGN